MIVVSDTSCITNLIAIGSVDLIPALFGQVVIPPAVAAELRRSHELLPAFLRMQTPGDTELVQRLVIGLDAGEAEAIALAKEIHADRLLIDEKAGRLVAMQHGIQVLGLLGVLLLARRRGLILSVKTHIERLESETSFYVDRTLRSAVIRDAGEDS